MYWPLPIPGMGGLLSVVTSHILTFFLWKSKKLSHRQLLSRLSGMFVTPAYLFTRQAFTHWAVSPALACLFLTSVTQSCWPWGCQMVRRPVSYSVLNGEKSHSWDTTLWHGHKILVLSVDNNRKCQPCTGVILIFRQVAAGSESVNQKAFIFCFWLAASPLELHSYLFLLFS